MVTMTRKRSAILLVAVPLIAVYFGVGYINEQQTLHAGGPLMHSTGYRFSTEGIGNEDRLLFWKYYLGVAANNPIIGKGSGYILSQFSAGINVPHNSFLDIQVEYGCVGLILYFGVFALVARTWIRYRKKFSSVLPDLLFSCFCGITVSLMTLSNPLARLQWAVAGGVSGVCLWAGRRPRSVQTRLGSVYQALGMSGGIATGYSEFLSKNPNSWSARSKKVNL
jgi:O-antigen ligase